MHTNYVSCIAMKLKLALKKILMNFMQTERSVEIQLQDMQMHETDRLLSN